MSENAETEKVTEAPTGDTEMSAPAETNGLAWPLPVQPVFALFDVISSEVDGETAVVVAMYTPSGAEFGWVTREGALALSKRLKQLANSGPTLPDAAPKKKLIVPGGAAKK